MPKTPLWNHNGTKEEPAGLQPHNWKCHPAKATMEMDSRIQNTVGWLPTKKKRQNKSRTQAPLPTPCLREKLLSTTHETSLSHHVGPWKTWSGFHQYRLVLVWPFDTHWMCVEKTAAGSLKRWIRPCCQSKVLLAISYGNKCNRMQSIAKQVTLALTATHKTMTKPREFWQWHRHNRRKEMEWWMKAWAS